MPRLFLARPAAERYAAVEELFRTARPRRERSPGRAPGLVREAELSGIAGARRQRGRQEALGTRPYALWQPFNAFWQNLANALRQERLRCSTSLFLCSHIDGGDGRWVGGRKMNHRHAADRFAQVRNRRVLVIDLDLGVLRQHIGGILPV